MFETMVVAVQAAPTAELVATQPGVTAYERSFFSSARPVNALEMLQRLPGFNLELGGGVRGFDGAAGNVLVNGLRPASKSDSLDEILRRIPASSVARIEIVRGSAQGVNMQGRDVVANVILEAGQGLTILAQAKGRVTSDGRALPLARVDISGEDDKRKWDLSARVESAESFNLGHGPQRRDAADGARLYSGRLDGEGLQTQYAATAAVELDLGQGNARFNARRLREDAELDDVLRVALPGPRTESNLSENQRDESEWGARFNYPLTTSLQTEWVGLWQTTRQKRRSTFVASGAENLFGQVRSSREAIARGSLVWTTPGSLTLEGAIEIADNRLKSVSDLLANGQPVALPAGRIAVSERRYQSLARAAWRWGEVQMEASLRRETSTLRAPSASLAKTLAYTKPKLTAAWSPSPGFTLRARVELLVGQINFDDFVAASRPGDGSVTAGNPNIEPPRPLVREVTVEKTFWGAGAMSLMLRSSPIKDVADRAPVRSSSGIFDAPSNIGEGRRDFAMLNLTLPLSRWGVDGAQVKLNATASRSWVIDPTTRTRRDISAVRPYTWSLSFTQDLPRRNLTWGVDLDGDYQETFYRFNEIETYKAHVLLGPFVEWRPAPKLTIRIDGDNLTRAPMRRTRTVFGGPRDAAGLAFTDARSARGPSAIMLTLRRSFRG